MNILYIMMGLLFISMAINIIQYWFIVDYKIDINNLLEIIKRLERKLENAETNERSIYE